MFIKISDSQKITGEVLDFLNEKGIEFTIDTPIGHFIRNEIEFDLENENIEDTIDVEDAINVMGDDWCFVDGLMENYRESLKNYLDSK